MIKIIRQHYGLIAVALFCAFCLFKAIDFPIHDFANYYFGGHFLVDGIFNVDTYFPYVFNKQIADLGYRGIFVSYAPNTPFLALFFTPFSLLSLATAKLIFNGISVLLFLTSIYRLSRFYNIKSVYLLSIPLLFFVPIRNELLFGQVYFILFFFLTEFWLAYQKERFLKSAFFLSLAILLKVFPVLLLLIFLFKKQLKPLCYSILFCFLFFGITALFTGFDIWFFYIQSVLPKASNGEIASAYVDNYQSVFMFLKRLLVEDSIENPSAFFNYPILFSALMMMFKFGIVGVGYFISKRTSNAFLILCYWILAMILLSPYGSTYTLILMLFPFVALLKSNISNIKKGVFCLLLFLICNLKLSVFINNSFPFSYLRLFLLLLFFGLFVIHLRQKTHWKNIAVLALIPTILVLVFQKHEPVKSTILLKNGPILIYDFKIETSPEDKHKYLTANFWDGADKLLFWKQSIQTAESLNLKDNQIFYNNQQLTFDKSHKLKPILIDNNTILYLSDYNRGIGFYTLREIFVK
ncbi:glycosyltransferase family 87 protein [Flavobacterium sp. 25HG05S-40]|uniref:glycosyltransferase family 87 protein n=1 Tax=Flavobacterium sp. 25HG05S-40 TaxID=3458682 RepID=UPI004044FD30